MLQHKILLSLFSVDWRHLTLMIRYQRAVLGLEHHQQDGVSGQKGG